MDISSEDKKKNKTRKRCPNGTRWNNAKQECVPTNKNKNNAPTEQPPQTTPLIPQTTPLIPQTTPLIPQTTPLIPQTTPLIPQTTPLIPQTTPLIPQTTPLIPQTTPLIPQTTPSIPTVPQTPSKTSKTTPPIKNLTKKKRVRCPNGSTWNEKQQKCIPKNQEEVKPNIVPTTNVVPELQTKEEGKSMLSSIIENIIPKTDAPVLTAKEKPTESPPVVEEKPTESVLGSIMSFVGLNSSASENKEDEQEEGKEEDNDDKKEDGDEYEVEEELKSEVKDEDDEEDEDEEEADDEDEEEEEEDDEENVQLFKKELEEKFFWEKNKEENLLYPHIDDPNFNAKIASKKEFKDNKYDGTVNKNIEEQANKECETSFEILPHQQFLRNFMSMSTPYNSLLLYHELGTGKTCSAIGITEEMRSYMKQTGVSQKILIIASPNVQENFKLQLFDPSKLQSSNGNWMLNTCVGNNFLKEINPTQIQGMTKEKVITLIRGIIKTNYTFMGYEQVSMSLISDEKRLKRKEDKRLKNKGIRKDEENNNEEIPEIVDMTPIKNSDDEGTKAGKRKLIKRLKDIYDNRLIVIDEVHNMLSRTEDAKKKSSKILTQIVRYCENTRFLFLSATPLYNSDKEITWLLNTINMNDKRATVKQSQIFNKNGEFVKEVRDMKGRIVNESGQDLLRRKLTGYVSYVRGENPYTFPYRIYPKDFAEPEHLLSTYTYPTKQLNGSDIREVPLKHVLNNIYVNKIGDYQKHVYKAIIDKLKKNDNFSGKESFGFQELITPLSVLNMTYPSKEMDAIIDSSQTDYKGPINQLHGKEGLSTIMSYDRVQVPQGKQTVQVIKNFEYNEYFLEKYGRIFHPDNIQKFSPKIHAICKAIENSTGTVLIYSKYIEGGLLPMALALEEMGFSRYSYASHIDSFLKTKATPLDPLTMKPKNDPAVANGPAKTNLTANYVMITGTKMFSPDNAKDLEMVFHPMNKDGRYVKVVMISQAGSEGIDFKCIRQIHILDPWYNMSRMEQIIGRGVRNKSHCQLPFSQRNVEIYMHGTTTEDDFETADMYLYRLAETKAIQIGQITRILKESAVDCLLNMGQNNFTEKNMNSEIELELSSNKKMIRFQVGDKAFSSKCDYMENCEYSCTPENVQIAPEEENVTYNHNHLRQNHDQIAKRIRQLYRDHAFYTKKKLLEEIQIGKPFPLPEIYYTLGQFLKNQQEWLMYRGITGHMTRKEDIYSFQPNEISDRHASLYDRMVPVDYKPRHLMIKLPDENQVPIIPDNNNVIEIVPKAGLTILSSSEKKSQQKQSISSEGEEEEDNRTFKRVMKNIENKMKKIRDDLPFVQKTDNKYEDYAKKALEELHARHNIPRDDASFHLANHFIDMLHFNDKCICFKSLFKKDADFEKETVKSYTTIQEVMYAYFKNCIVQDDKEMKGIYVANETKNDLFLWIENTWKSGKEHVVESTQLKKAIQQKFVVTDGLLTRTLSEIKQNEGIGEIMVGYMSYIPKEETYFFKAKDIFQVRNGLGSRCDQEPKPLIIKRLNNMLSFLEKPEKEMYDKSNKNHRSVICIIYEMLIRVERFKTGIIWFLSLEESILIPPKLLIYDKEKSNWADTTKRNILDLLKN